MLVLPPPMVVPEPSKALILDPAAKPVVSLPDVGPQFVMPSPFAEYGVLNTENGTPLCQNAVPETCHPLTIAPTALFRDVNGN